MILARRIDAVRAALSAARQAGRRIALVPTLGALHAGHLELVRLAHQQADVVAMSIFVNPTQFGPAEDLSRYPRPLERDLELAEEAGVGLVFHPSEGVMYPTPPALGVDIRGLADHLCGASRPGHFNGVLQVVNKLFNIFQPDVAVFGQKDIQQFRLIETMVAEYDHPIRLIRAETTREADGLALSSRNAYLTPEQRSLAPAIHRELRHIAATLTANPETPVSELCEASIARLQAIGFKNDYLSVVDYASLTPAAGVASNQTHIIAAAQFLGTTRLIDNVLVDL
jgi:pantoate--beta-alanine ligase